jgi:hypothetical protein
MSDLRWLKSNRPHCSNISLGVERLSQNWKPSANELKKFYQLMMIYLNRCAESIHIQRQFSLRRSDSPNARRRHMTRHAEEHWRWEWSQIQLCMCHWRVLCTPGSSPTDSRSRIGHLEDSPVVLGSSFISRKDPMSRANHFFMKNSFQIWWPSLEREVMRSFSVMTTTI